ncbi:MAG: lycopene cyclase domain-containing protein [Nakamurella sp.]
MIVDHVYSYAAVASILVAVLVDLRVLRTRLLTTRLFWASYAIVLFFQFIVNGILTGLDIVQYDPRVILGLRVFFAPVEDIGFGFGMVTLTMSSWVWWGRRSRRSASSVQRP